MNKVTRESKESELSLERAEIRTVGRRGSATNPEEATGFATRKNGN
jgi:hypothetical protein